MTLLPDSVNADLVSRGNVAMLVFPINMDSAEMVVNIAIATLSVRKIYSATLKVNVP